MQSESRVAVGVWVVAGLATVFFAVYAVGFFGYVLDDVFISLRYAQNWVEGNGVVFNAGEVVEGYTNFLLVALAAGAIRMGLDPVLVLKVLSLGAAIWTVFVASLLAGTGDEDTRGWRRFLPLTLLLPLHGFAYWSVVPMETMLFTALTATGVFLLASRSRAAIVAAGLTFAVLAMTRPEGLLVFGLSILAFAGMDLAVRQPGAGLRRYFPALLSFAVPFGLFFWWRMGYYGRPFPNTFYAKVEGEASEWLHGLSGLGAWLLAHPVLALAVPAGLVLGLRRFRVPGPAGARIPVLEVSATAAGWVAYTILIGGDDMPLHRFYVPILPLLAVVATWIVDAWVVGTRAARVGPAFAVLGVVSAAASALAYDADAVFSGDRLTVVGERVGRWLAASQPADTLVALNTAGAIPYFSKLPTLDMLGLTDAVIAHHGSYDARAASGHRRGHGRYVLDRRPDIILWYNSAGAFEPEYPGDWQLAGDPRFRLFYRPRSVGLRYGPSPDRFAYPLRSFLGYPWGRSDAGESWATNYGLYARYHSRPVPRTELFEGPIVFRFFEFDRELAQLWPETDPAGVLARLRSRPESSASSPEVPTACSSALDRLAAGDRAGAVAILRQPPEEEADAVSGASWPCRAVGAALEDRPFDAISDLIRVVRDGPSDPFAEAALEFFLTAPYESLTGSGG